MPFTKCSSGVFLPDDLELLQRVFDRLCQERRLRLKDGEQREHLACEVIEGFQNGFAGETELWQSLSIAPNSAA
ncbi:hypothetical protein EN827_30430 [Mesorhizobium sp. M1D.F.Ca.ET.184.01.1.1]|nr:hypothetical protein EN874_030870 [Mesorhizobium sp. M1D.F.Ca.ET.231.01.1.1]TGP25369.1 hypothetical protein EN877_30130 [Mesorhizobium sp. M1D.F.Ca.ET.234.01.1.1]TGS37835.1 hypothetical protein EN827_30430 [Mesorhizobium sp. M1D.F.Ca.ET.184.01.1.1]TGS58188.1 hypothetical protein EN826_030405 [Mesorhizobium sp. M1D.F.Ca.ET.183.01.1.1]